jgi:tRNA(His) 5'-end guanylyltransferase
MKNTFTKGKANRVTLAERMKKYEAVTTGTTLIERLPIYARIDMRAGHTWCRDLIKPFDPDYCNAMKEATSYIVEKTGAIVGYCQSDEASFVWLDSSKTPFETRLFKLQSILSSMFTAAFIKACVNTKLWNKIENGKLPSFDCRVCNMPSLDEAVNMILWREQDSIKNSITLLALEYFSNKEIHKKNSVDKIEMLADKEHVTLIDGAVAGATKNLFRSVCDVWDLYSKVDGKTYNNPYPAMSGMKPNTTYTKWAAGVQTWIDDNYAGWLQLVTEYQNAHA